MDALRARRRGRARTAPAGARCTGRSRTRGPTVRCSGSSTSPLSNVAEATVFALPAEIRCTRRPPLAVPAGLRGCAAVVIGVIDIGTNTTRLLVAEVEGRAIAAASSSAAISSPRSPTEEAGALAGLLEREAAIARESGAQALISAGTAGCAEPAPARGLDRACARIGAGGLRVLSERRGGGARLPRRHCLRARGASGSVAVVDVGGGSTEVAVGTPGQPPGWWASRPVGSHGLTERALRSDPPTRDQVAAARNAAARPLRRSGAAGLRAGAGGGRRGRLAAAPLGRRDRPRRDRRAARAARLGAERGAGRRARPRPAAGAAPAGGAGRPRGRLRAAARAAADRPRRSAGGAGAGARPRSWPQRRRRS